MMNYCRKHDLLFCETHKDNCLASDCTFVQLKTSFCSVCNGVVKVKP